MKNKNSKNIIILITSIVVLLPVLIGVLVPDYKFNIWISLVIPVSMLAVHWFALWVVFKDNSNREQNHKIISMVYWLVPVLSLITSGTSIMASMGKTLHIDVFVRIGLGLIFVIMGNYMPKCKPNYTIGVRVPWTLKNEENWNKTHRFTGKLWVCGGIFSLATLLVDNEKFSIVFFAAIILLAIIPAVYSYIYYRKQLKLGTASKDERVVDENNPFTKKTVKISLITGAVVAIVALVFAFTGDYEIALEDSQLAIDARFWSDEKIQYKDISDIEYRDSLVPGTRTSGYGSFTIVMGQCENKEFGSHIRYTYSSSDACIILTVDGEKVVINEKSVDDTKALYDQLLEKIGK